MEENKINEILENSMISYNKKDVPLIANILKQLNGLSINDINEILRIINLLIFDLARINISIR